MEEKNPESLREYVNLVESINTLCANKFLDKADAYDILDRALRYLETKLSRE